MEIHRSPPEKSTRVRERRVKGARIQLDPIAGEVYRVLGSRDGFVLKS
jgi:hypothetical protein